MTITMKLTQEQFEALRDCIDYILEGEETHYEESLEEEDDGVCADHIYLRAVTASKIDWEEV